MALRGRGGAVGGGGGGGCGSASSIGCLEGGKDWGWEGRRGTGQACLSLPSALGNFINP